MSRDIIWVEKLMKDLKDMSQEIKDIIEDYPNKENPREVEIFHTLKPSINKNQLNEVRNKTRNDLYPGSRVLEVESEDTNKKLGEDLNYNVNKEIENIEHGRKEIITRSKTRNNKVKFHEFSYL